MRLLGKSLLVLGLAGAVATGSMTASQARVHGGAIAAGAAGFAAGAAIGAAASSGGYYADPGYNAYGYYDGPATAYTADPAYDSYAYSPGYSTGYEPYSYSHYHYNSNSTGPMHERQLEGRDY